MVHTLQNTGGQNQLPHTSHYSHGFILNAAATNSVGILHVTTNKEKTYPVQFYSDIYTLSATQ